MTQNVEKCVILKKTAEEILNSSFLYLDLHQELVESILG